MKNAKRIIALGVGVLMLAVVPRAGVVSAGASPIATRTSGLGQAFDKLPWLAVRVLPRRLVLRPLVQAAPVRSAYKIVPIGPLGSQVDSFSVGINPRGDVVGQVGTATQVPFLYRNGRFMRLTPPSGVGDAQATGINNSDTISVQAYGSEGDSLAFAVKPKAGGFVWIPLSTGSLQPKYLYVAGVASNGDIDGGLTFVPDNCHVVQRSVIWRVRSNGEYRPARIVAPESGICGDNRWWHLAP
jgi:hypothetical protein